MPPVTGTDSFIGREREMAELTAAFEGALEGRGGLVMLVGEPGIGKTRIAEELAAAARDRGAQAHWGFCREVGGAPPYWPWVQAIQSILKDRDSDVIQSELSTGAAVIAEIVPEIRQMLPDLQQPPAMEPEQARFRLFSAVTTLLKIAAASQPMVVVLDDLHWADRASLDLLEFAAPEISSTQMLLIGGYRDVELSRRHPLAETLAALARVRGFQRIFLRGLDSPDVGRLIEAVGDITPVPALVEEIHERTEGNPFFVTEVTRDLAAEAAGQGGVLAAAGGFRIPEGVREAIGIRLNRLSEECNEVLRTAAVIGREFDFTLLAEVSDKLAEDALLSAVEEAIRAGAIRGLPGSGERYEFAHALIQQTLAEELSAAPRVRLHASIVGAIEELYGDNLENHVAELAHHCVEAKTVVGEKKIAYYARMAGERAAASYAWVGARAYFEQSLEALEEDAPDVERAAVLFGLGKAELLSLTYPDIQRGWDRVAQAFDLYDALGDSGSAVKVVRQSRGYPPLWVHGTAEVISRALEMVDPGSVDAGYLLEQYSAAIRFEQVDAAGSLDALDQALEIARRTGDKRLESRVLVSLAYIRLFEGDFRDVIELCLESLELARETDQPVEEARSRQVLSNALISLGDPDAGSRHLEAAQSLKEQFGVETFTLWLQYVTALLRGDLAEVNKLGEVIDIDHPHDSVNRLFAGIGAWHIEERPDMDDRLQAAQEEAQIAPTLWQRGTNIVFLALAGRVMDRRGVAIQAGEMARSILGAPRLAPENEENARIAAGLAAVAAGDAGEASEHYQRLENKRGTLAREAYPFSRDRLLGLLAHTAGMPERADAHFEDALEFTDKAGYRLEAAWTGHDYAESLLDSGDPPDVEKAVSLIDDGLEITREIGSIPLEKRLIGLQERAAAIAAPTPGYPDGLTGREVEVLRLLAAGRSNRQIADELVIAPNTAAKHVANILGKTGSANRAEAGAYAHEHGMTAAR